MKIYPLGTMNCCKQVSSQSFWKLSDTSMKAKNVYLLVALEENSGDHFSIQDLSILSILFIYPDHERGYKPSWQSVRQLLRWFCLGESGWSNSPINQLWSPSLQPFTVSISQTAPSHGCKIKHLCKNQPPCWLISPPAFCIYPLKM